MGNKEEFDIVLEFDNQELLASSWQVSGNHCGCYWRTCCGCGKMFYTRQPKGKYCSPACRQRAYRKRLKARE